VVSSATAALVTTIRLAGLIGATGGGAASLGTGIRLAGVATGLSAASGTELTFVVLPGIAAAMSISSVARPSSVADAGFRGPTIGATSDAPVIELARAA
jgi:hypothetical protein